MGTQDLHWKRMGPSLLLTAIFAVIAATSTGCLVSGTSKHVRSGNYVSEDTFSRIKPGKTTAGWVAATLGEPTTRTHLDDGSEVWKWTYTETRDSSGAVFLLFGHRSQRTTDGAAFVELKNGLVVNKWRG
jgi:outer membrane protein assembly factor BamE (lipoprotein component of BamABCDE complex)